MTQTKHTTRKDDYFDLIQEFPLKAIRTSAELERANNVLAALVMSKPEESMTIGERDYLEALVVLVRDAEKKIIERLTKGVTPLDMLKHLMEETDMNVNDLGKIVGSQSNASMIFNGKRPFSKATIHKLAKHFGISPAVFL